jgi:hypothetical protein
MQFLRSPALTGAAYRAESNGAAQQIRSMFSGEHARLMALTVDVQKELLLLKTNLA